MSLIRVLQPLSSLPDVGLASSVLFDPAQGYVALDARPEQLVMSFTAKSELDGWRLTVTPASGFAYAADGTAEGVVAGLELTNPSGVSVVTLQGLEALGLSVSRIIADPALALGGDDRIEGSQGADDLPGLGGADLIFGLDGDDLLAGGAGSDTLNGNAGADTLFGEDGDDFLYGNRDDDRIFGGAGDDIATGGLGLDTLSGGDGDDALFGNAGDDALSGGDGHDRLFGERDSDTLAGGAGHDALYGGAGADRLSGGSGDDLLDGGAGDDILDAGAGYDRLYGGDGQDTARFSGRRADYTITVVDEVTHVVGADGSAALVSVETLLFADDPAAAPAADDWVL